MNKNILTLSCMIRTNVIKLHGKTAKDYFEAWKETQSSFANPITVCSHALKKFVVLTMVSSIEFFLLSLCNNLGLYHQDKLDYFKIFKNILFLDAAHQKKLQVRPPLPSPSLQCFFLQVLQFSAVVTKLRLLYN